MTESLFTVAREAYSWVRGDRVKAVKLRRGERAFKVTDEAVGQMLLDWSPPVQLRLVKAENGLYDLVARRYFATAPDPEPRLADATSEDGFGV